MSMHYTLFFYTPLLTVSFVQFINMNLRGGKVVLSCGWLGCTNLRINTFITCYCSLCMLYCSKSKNNYDELAQTKSDKCTYCLCL